MIPAVTGATANLARYFLTVKRASAQAEQYTTDQTTFTNSDQGFGTTAIKQIATDGAGMYVCVGDSGKLSTSPDGITWTLRTSSFGTDNITSVAYGNGYWVAVGGLGKIATATDPTGTWTQRTGYSAKSVLSISYGAGVWMAAGADVSCYKATDPTSTWSAVTVGGYGATVNITVFYSKTFSRWISCAVNTPFFRYSTNAGTTWTSGTATGGPGVTSAIHRGENGTEFVTGNYYTNDGTTFTAIPASGYLVTVVCCDENGTWWISDSSSISNWALYKTTNISAYPTGRTSVLSNATINGGYNPGIANNGWSERTT